MKKGYVKSHKPVKPARVFTKVLSLIMILGALLTFAGCRDKLPVDSSTDTSSSNIGTSIDSSTDTSTETQNPSTDTETDTETQTKMSFDEFLEKHPEIAQNFAEDSFNQISYIKNALSTQYSFVEKDGKIEKIIVANVVETGETERQLKIATINIVPSVDVEDLVEDNVDKFAVTIQTETVMTFDAKENYKNDTFELVEKEISQLVEQHLGDQTFTAQEYQQESFAPQTVEELVADYPEKVNEILNETCFDTLIKKCVPINYNPENIISAKWYIDGDKEITGVSLLLNYKSSDTSNYYRLGKSSFTNNVSIEDFINMRNIEIEEAKNIYGFSYAVDVQNTRNDLVNAIFEANGMSKECPEGAIRLFRDNGDQLEELGQVREFIVVQISDKEIKQFGVCIKKSSSDEQYIQQLKNSGYRIYDTYTKNIVMEGTEIPFINTALEQQQVKTINIILEKKQREIEEF